MRFIIKFRNKKGLNFCNMKTLLALAAIFLTGSASAEGYMLPKSFSIKNTELTPVEEKKPETPVTVDISLISLIRNFEYDYASTFKSTLSTLLQFNIIPVDYDSARGWIKARSESGRELFILLLPSREKLTHVRITPADGRYDISAELVNDIFKAIERSLYSGV